MTTPTMQTSQKISLTVFLVGFASFFYFTGEMLLTHTDWNELRTPPGVGEVFNVFFWVLVSVGGALGVNILDLVRRAAGTQQSRREDDP